jgi:hypothetical protein
MAIKLWHDVPEGSWKADPIGWQYPIPPPSEERCQAAVQTADKKWRRCHFKALQDEDFCGTHLRAYNRADPHAFDCGVRAGYACSCADPQKEKLERLQQELAEMTVRYETVFEQRNAAESRMFKLEADKERLLEDTRHSVWVEQQIARKATNRVERELADARAEVAVRDRMLRLAINHICDEEYNDRPGYENKPTPEQVLADLRARAEET